MPGTITVYQGAPPAGATAAQLAAARGDHDFLLAGAQTTEELNRRLSFAEIRPSPDGSGAIIPRADLMWWPAARTDPRSLARRLLHRGCCRD